MTKSYVKSFKYRSSSSFYIKMVRKYKVHIDTVYMLKCLLRQKVRSPSLRLLMLRVHAWKFHTRCVNDNICYMYSTSFWTFLLTITVVAFLNIHVNEFNFLWMYHGVFSHVVGIFIKINHIRYRTLHVICDMFNSVHNLKLVFWNI